MKIYLATDHAGFEMKENIKNYLNDFPTFEVVDFGAHEYLEDDDYTDYIHNCMSEFQLELEEDKNVRAIILGGSGQGEAMVANRYAGVRAIVYYGQLFDIVKLGREHNDANTLSLGARFVEGSEALRAVAEFLETPFGGEERHERRVNKINIQ